MTTKGYMLLPTCDQITTQVSLSVGKSWKFLDCCCLSWMRSVFRHITVEPLLFFLFLPSSLDDGTRRAFITWKTCEAGKCGNATASTVGEQVAVWYLLSQVVAYVVPLISAGVLAAWTDIHGPKAAMLVGMVGKTLYYFTFVCNSYYTRWAVEYSLLTASVPCLVTGCDVTVMMAACFYMSELTLLDGKRTFRFAVLEIVAVASCRLGYHLGNGLVASVPEVFYVTYPVCLCVSALGILYVGLRFGSAGGTQQDHVGSICDALKSTLRPFVLLFLLLGFFGTMYKCDDLVLERYVDERFSWKFHASVDFLTLKDILAIAGVILAVPILTMCLGLRDTSLAIIGIFSALASRLIYALAAAPWLFYLGSSVAALSPLLQIAVKTSLCRIASCDHRAKAFALMASLEGSSHIAGSVLYNHLYNDTKETFPPSIFYLTVGFEVFTLAFAILAHIVVVRTDTSRAPPVGEDTALVDPEATECYSFSSSVIGTPSVKYDYRSFIFRYFVEDR